MTPFPDTILRYIFNVILTLPAAAQFLQGNPLDAKIIWADLMKRGRLSTGDVNDLGEVLAHGLKKFPQTSCAIVIAPGLVSDKVPNGMRGELRPVGLRSTDHVG